MNVRTLTNFQFRLFRIASETLFFIRSTAGKALCTIVFFVVSIGNLHAENLPTTEDLVNSIWITESGYSYVTVATDGTIESFDGANFYLEFKEISHGVLVGQARWVSPNEKLGETQYLLFLPDGIGSYSFQAAGALNVVGGAANGSMRIVADDTALFTSFNLENDRAGSINTTLTKVDKLPPNFESKD